MPYLVDCVFYMPFSRYHNSLLKLSTLSLMLMDSFVSLCKSAHLTDFTEIVKGLVYLMKLLICGNF